MTKGCVSDTWRCRSAIPAVADRVLAGMDRSEGHWTVTRSSPVRADAEGMFVPVDDLPDASIGDHVVIAGPDGDDRRTGVIIERTDSQGQSFFRVDLDTEAEPDGMSAPPGP